MLKKLKARSTTQWLGFLGFLGFMGLGETFQGESQYQFFAFFGFFSYFIIGYITKETPDERMIYNYQRANAAMIKYYSLILVVLWIFVILNKSMIHIQAVSMELIELIVAWVFAFSLILNAALIYYYEKVE